MTIRDPDSQIALNFAKFIIKIRKDCVRRLDFDKNICIHNFKIRKIVVRFVLKRISNTSNFASCHN